MTALVGGGELRFARYALAPNRLGYCGPGDELALFEQAVALTEARPSEPGAPRSVVGTPVVGKPVVGKPVVGKPVDDRTVDDRTVDEEEVVAGLRSLAQGFEGAWPYLELIAGANAIEDPLDDRVVAAYWLGGPLLRNVGAFATGNHIGQRFEARAGKWWGQVAAALEPGASPSHAFHVMVVGPWVGMLRGGHVQAPLEVMDRCRIRRGLVVDVEGDTAVVRTDRVRFGHGRLRVGGPNAEPEIQTVRLGIGGRHPCGPVAVGDTVAIHWDWVCEVIDANGAAMLGHAESEAVERANRALAVPGSAELG